MSANNKEDKETNKGKFIAKVVFCIVVFNIVVRSDLWISVCVFFFIGVYLLQMGIVKKIQGYFSVTCQAAISKAIQKSIQAVQAVHEQNMKQKQEQEQEQEEPKKKSCTQIVIDGAIQNESAFHTPERGCMDFIAVPPDRILNGDSFEEIWLNYPDHDVDNQ